MTKQQHGGNRQDESNRKSAGSRETHHEEKGDMSVREAGHKGGQRVRELIDEGHESEGQGGKK